MTCLNCGGAGLLLDFDTSTYDLCSCAHGALRKAHMSSVKVLGLISRAASVDTRPEGGDATEIAAPFTSGAVGEAETPNASHRSTGE